MRHRSRVTRRHFRRLEGEAAPSFPDSPDGNAWAFITHEMARSRAYRWGEAGIGGLSDEQGLLCFALACGTAKIPS